MLNATSHNRNEHEHMSLNADIRSFEILLVCLEDGVAYVARVRLRHHVRESGALTGCFKTLNLNTENAVVWAVLSQLHNPKKSNRFSCHPLSYIPFIVI